MTQRNDVSRGEGATVNPMARIAGIAALLCCLTVFTAGCTLFKQGPVVPEYPTAREQAQNAMRQYQWASRTVDQNFRREEYVKAAAALQETVTRFPKDRVYTPAAHSLLAQTHAEMGEHRKAERVYREVLELYPEVEDVNATSLLGLARSLRAQRKYQAEKNYLRQLIDSYEESANPAIRDLVRIAEIEYSQIENPDNPSPRTTNNRR